MPIHLYKRPNGVYHLRGSVQGRRIDQSARTRSRVEAEQIKAQLEHDLFRRVVYGDDAVATFAEAVVSYMMAGGEGEHLDALLERFGDRRLRDIGQLDLDRLAAERPDAAPATLVRQIYTPMSAVLNFAASPAGGRLCPAPDFRKPVVRNGRTAFLTPSEAEEWLTVLPPYLARLVTFYLATGCRASEALALTWADVTPDAERAVFWITKGGYARSVNLGQRARDALGPRGEGAVFRNSRGKPWHAYDAINLMLRKIGARHPHLRPVHCHLFRHTWATWAYACTRDLTFVRESGGWRSLSMVERYTHLGSPDLARAVLAQNWEFSGRVLPGLLQ